MTDEADVERGRRIARHYPLHRVLRESLAHEIAYAIEDARSSSTHDCEHTSLQHGADGCNATGCLCAFMSWDES